MKRLQIIIVKVIFQICSFRKMVLFSGALSFFTFGVGAQPSGAVDISSSKILKAAAKTFSVTPKIGEDTDSRTGAKIEKVIGDLKSTVILFEYGNARLCFLTSPLRVEGGPISTPTFNIANLNIASKALISKELGISRDQIVAATSHNHTIPRVIIKNPEAWGQSGGFPPLDESNDVGREFMEKLAIAVRGLENELVPVTVEWGAACEDRLTYNRRGRREDGRTYLIREEDRIELGESYLGTIDPEAMVVVLRDEKKLPVAALTFYTGHPVTGYHPETLVSHGQWPQVANDKLSEYLGGAPVAFFQGCAGDVNSKYMLTGTIEQTCEFGEYLGESFIKAANNLQPSKRSDLKWTREKVKIPHAELPDSISLIADLAAIDDFIRRGDAGDENTRECVGMNFPKALSPPYRARLVEMVRPWYVWALEHHRAGTLPDVPKYLEIEIVISRIGDVGYVGLPFEPFVRTGLKIKKETPLPFVLTSGYTDGGFGYIPDATACDDREYMSGFFRYVKRPPYSSPGGDAAADVAIKVLTAFSR